MNIYPTDDKYVQLIISVLEDGVSSEDRTGTGTISNFGCKETFDISNMKIPLLGGKKVLYKPAFVEMLWFLKGMTNISYLKENNCNIWDKWADADGELGPVYGSQWRNFAGTGYDQIEEAINLLKTDPESRRNIITAWNPLVLPVLSLSPSDNASIGKQALPPCHMTLQLRCYRNKVTDEFELYGLLYQRSADVFLGVPFNIANYSLLLHLLAHKVGMKAKTLTWVGGDVHIYQNHFNAVKEYIDICVSHKSDVSASPYIELLHDPEKPLEDLSIEDIVLHDYEPYPLIKAPVAV